jgi:hypothetical protein
LRNVVLSTWLISLPVYGLFLVAAPCLADQGMADTITTQTGFALDTQLTTALYNPRAPLPATSPAGSARRVASGWSSP